MMQKSNLVTDEIAEDEGSSSGGLESYPFNMKYQAMFYQEAFKCGFKGIFSRFFNFLTFFKIPKFNQNLRDQQRLATQRKQNHSQHRNGHFPAPLHKGQFPH
jgi:hypothetical protein